MENTRPKQVSCTEYRKEMMLLGLQKRLNASDITEAEKQAIEGEIAKLQSAMQLD